MPKILRIINRLNLGGPTYNVAYLTRYLTPEFETLLVAGTKQDSEESSQFILEEMNVRAMVLPEMQRNLSVLNDYATYRHILQIIREYKPDIVHTHASKAGAVGRLAAATAGVPVIVHTFHGHVFHSYFSRIKTRLFIGIERYLARKTTAIIAISDLQKRELCEQFRICKPEKTHVIHLGFDLDRFTKNILEKRQVFRTLYGLKSEDVAIGIIGRIVPVKNHFLFLDALKILLAATTKSVKAFIIGDGEFMQRTREYCTQIGLNYSDLSGSSHAPVIFTSWIHEIDQAYAGLDIVALSSLNEGTPVSLIEAQAAGKAIVSTCVGGVENVVMEGESALLCEPEATSFAKHLLQLTENEELRIAMGNKGREQVIEKFRYQNLVDNTRALYRALLRKSQSL